MHEISSVVKLNLIWWPVILQRTEHISYEYFRLKQKESQHCDYDMLLNYLCSPRIPAHVLVITPLHASDVLSSSLNPACAHFEDARKSASNSQQHANVETIS